MRFYSIVFGFAAVAASVRAHATVWGVQINGVDQGDGQKKYIRSPPSNFPVKDLTSNSMACNVNNRAVPMTLKVKTGDTVTFEWFHQTRGDEIIAPSHKGPVSAYIAPTSSNGAGDVWVKLFQEGLDGSWATEKLVAARGHHSIKIPNIAAGQYMLRPELIALHEGYTTYPLDPTRGAQLYISCIQIEVEGDGPRLPAGVSFPGAYKYSDPGIHYNLYPSPPPYVVPGPAVWSGSAGGSIGQVGTASQSPAKSPAKRFENMSKNQQCGGKGWLGGTTCVSGSTCVRVNDYYYHCQ